MTDGAQVVGHVGCTDTQHRCIALGLAFFAEMAAVEQTPELVQAAVRECTRARDDVKP